MRRDFKVCSLSLNRPKILIQPALTNECAMPRFSCPNCDKSLKTSVDVPAGKKIKCPGCSHVFRLPEESEIAEPVAAVHGGETPRSAQHRGVQETPTADDSGSREEPAPRKPKKKAPAKNKQMLLILSGVAAVLALLAVTAFVWPGFLLSNAAKTKAGGSAPRTARGPRPGNMPEKKGEDQPEELHRPAPAYQGDAPGKRIECDSIQKKYVQSSDKQGEAPGQTNTTSAEGTAPMLPPSARSWASWRKARKACKISLPRN